MDLYGCGTVVRELPHPEVRTLVMSLPAIAGADLLAPLTGAPIASAPAVLRHDSLPVWLLLVTAELDPALARRIRGECAELEAILTGTDPSAVLPIVDHGVDAGRPYLLVPRPGPDLAELGPLPVATVIPAADAVAAGLDALATRGIITGPRGLCRTGTDGIVLATPLPPALLELEASLGSGTGHEPPEVLGGADWTPAGQAYACASLLWTLLCGQPPPSRLARLVAAEPAPMRRMDVPEPVVAVLRGALAVDPAGRPETPAALARLLREATRSGGSDTTRPLGSQYLLDSQIGQGASGLVWAGRRRADGGPVAVKILRADLTDDEQAVSRFVREFRVLLRLRHPHLVQVHDLVVEGGLLSIVMDLVDGEDLRRVAARGRLPVTDAAALLAQTASGLAAVHAAGVVHRDVKPENVLVTRREGRPVALLSDFGIARAIEGSAHTQMIGTPTYLAPELVAGRAPTPAADVYALGVTAYELLAGRPPFRAENLDALLLAHLDEHPTRPDGLPDEVWHLLLDCLAKAPEARPTAAEVATRWARLGGVSPDFQDLAVSAGENAATSGNLRHAPEATLTSARPLAVRPPEPAPRRSRRRLVLAAAVVGLVGLASGVLLALRDTPPTAQPESRVARQYPITSSVSLDASGVATLTWGSQAAGLPGFSGYLVLEVSGEGAHSLTNQTLAGDVTSYQVRNLRPGRQACYLVIAVGVTTPPPQPLPGVTCVTPPSNVRTPAR